MARRPGERRPAAGRHERREAPRAVRRGRRRRARGRRAGAGRGRRRARRRSRPTATGSATWRSSSDGGAGELLGADRRSSGSSRSRSSSGSTSTRAGAADRAAARFANPDLVPNLVPHSPGWRRHVPSDRSSSPRSPVLVVGIARPHVVRDVTRNEATIVLAIDTSRSMAATDVEPSRFDSGTRRKRRRSSRRCRTQYAVGIVSFATSADPVLPPTLDREAARVALRELRLGSGTALGTAVTRAVDIALGRREEEAPPTQQGERSPAAVLVLSDGAQTSGEVRPLPAAQRARRLGVPVSAVAVGTGQAVVEVPLPGGLKQRVVVPPEPQTLRQIAHTTGGTFVPSPGAGLARAPSTRSSGHDSRAIASGSRSRRRSPRAARCCCSSAARCRRTGSGGPCEAALPRAPRRRGRRGASSAE